MSKTIQAAALRATVENILVANGSAQSEAATVAHNLVLANLSGHDSHGVGMLPRYVDAVLEGGLTPNTGAKVVLDAGTLLTIDGGHGFGQVIGEQAMAQGIARAQQHGSCIMTVKSAHHLGRIGHFSEMAVAQGLVSLHFVNVIARPIVAPTGGGDGRFGTNPCCIGIPLKDQPPFVLDFATSRVAQGKMRVAHNEGRKIPPGYLIDEHGNPTSDPGVVVVPQSNGLFGALMTFGEYKGYGMAVACELLGGALSGGATWRGQSDGRAAVLNSMLTVLIDPGKLGTRDSFEHEAAEFITWLKQSPAPKGATGGVQIAGDPERAARIARERDGIVVDDNTWAAIVEAGGKVGYKVD
jgi:hydroxycarboxylate dehydrogenase B